MCLYLKKKNLEMMLQHLSLFSLWLRPVLCCHSAFLCQSSYFFSVTWAMVEHVSTLLYCCCCCLFSSIVYSLSLNYLTRWEQTLHLCGGLPAACSRVIDTSQTRPLTLIGCIKPGAMDSCLYLIHDDNFSKYNKNIVTDYSFKKSWNVEKLTGDFK